MPEICPRAYTSDTGLGAGKGVVPIEPGVDDAVFGTRLAVV
jgi:hypothetical protein